MMPRSIFTLCPLCLYVKPSHSYFQPFLFMTKSVKTSKLFQISITNGNNGIMQEASNNELSSIQLHQQGGVVAFLPVLPSILSFTTQRKALIVLCYILFANIIYLQRRSHLRKMTKRRLFQIRTTKEDGVNLVMYVLNVVAWQVFVISIFPVLEPLSRLFGYVSFYYFYPNADGFGIIFEPLSVQHLPMSKRQCTQIRLDWHRFSLNVGNVGRDGYRHPPSVERNLPHLDIPRLKLKHWPWRRKQNMKMEAERRRSIERKKTY